jgi:hypothetical protein
MRKRSMLLLTAMATALLLVSGLALAADSTKSSTIQSRATKAKPDAKCQVRPNLTFSGLNGNDRFAQTFTVQHTGKLTKAQAHVAKSPGSSGDYLLEISKVDGSGVPTGEIIALQFVPNSKVPAGSNSTVTAKFSNPAQVTANQKLALIVTRPVSSNLAVRVNSQDPCGGSLFRSEGQDGTFFEESGEDLLYATFVKRS